MPHAHWPRFLALSLLSFAILFQYQNCAPGGNQANLSSSSDASDESGIVHAMGTSAASPVQLVSTVVNVAANNSEANATISGACSSSATPSLSWVIRDPELNEEIAAGSTPCIDNKFSQDVALNHFECGKAYDLHVDDAEGALTGNCPN